jgi:hypothetical protein
MTAPSLAPADAELARLEQAAAAIAANLVDLDDNPSRKDLDKGPLTGETAVAWADARNALTQLWDGYRLLTELITKARAVRDQRRFGDSDKAEFGALVLGGSITLSTTTVPLAQRGLLGAGQVSATCTPGELLAAMEAAFATVVKVASTAGDVWQRLLPAAAEVAARLDTVRRLSGGSTPTLDEANRRLGEFTAALAGDPLGCDQRNLDTARALIDRADAERTSAQELRENLSVRLAEAHRLADDIDAATTAAVAAEQSVVGRFADDVIASADGPDVRPDLAAVEALAMAGHWSLVSPRLHDWTQRARQRLATVRDAGGRNGAMLAERNELRGRLDGYRAKALRRGLGENSDLTPLAEAAHTALYTAPCDLDAARRAVDAYQDGLNAIMRDGQS